MTQNLVTDQEKLKKEMEKLIQDIMRVDYEWKTSSKIDMNTKNDSTPSEGI